MTEGKILFVDLSKQTSWEESVPDHVRKNYIGGKGLAAWLLYEHTGQNEIDPLGADNPVIFAAGPLTGTGAPSMRGVVVSTSPLTGGFVDSYYGGHFAQELKYAGYEALFITGQATEPVFIQVEDNEVKILPAHDYWGMDTFAVNAAIKRDLQDPSVKIAAIGPAGEQLVSFALVSCEYNRQAGRGGIGAVMGSKKLKAVSVKGTNLVPVADKNRFQQSIQEAERELLDSPDIRLLTEYGTATSLWFAHNEGLLPVHNYKKGTFAPDNLDQHAQNEKIWLRSTGCAGCPIRCSKVGVIRQGKRKGTVTDIVEYETAAMMGTNLGIDDIREVAYLVDLCDGLGLDGMSCGSAVGFVMECLEKGILTPQQTGGLALSFGSTENVAALIEQIAYQNGPLGELLAGGAANAAAKLGPEAEEFAVHVKKMDVPAWGPRGVPGMGLAYMTADRGACHQRGFPINYEAGGVPFNDREVERLAIHGKAEMVIHDQNYSAALDTMVKCDFGTFGISEDTYRKLYEAATGDALSSERLERTGERIWNLTRLINLKQGLTYEDEKLPKRFHQPLPDGPEAGHKFTREDELVMLNEYYRLRGWDEKGRPTTETLLNLAIK
ncbi:aldehyde ferredoxin oxidoreductase family protein [Dethiobacter alkaliphilus]|uniref:aldehyde ferredoxin oxidoreductase family protein n=1 Tax=Dethiobacter alkaliphilus TaxID=427926 RepID=UPI00222693E1|nr:aldehyde ferredoxin oxidoreductase family protein [Dethiobacter alkaliphilus]MCW3489062.1 aldehyde ferredoxin oxidoreductase family protein [Dethiobacter alkaliphilus]